MGIPRRLGRLARGFVSTLQEDEQLNERVRQTIRSSRESGESLKQAVGTAWRGAAEEWRSSGGEQRSGLGDGQESNSKTEAGSRSRRSWIPRKYPPEVLSAYERLGLDTGTEIEEVHRKRRELVKRYHPDRFSDPEKRAKAERLTARINAAHDTIRRHEGRG